MQPETGVRPLRVSLFVFLSTPPPNRTHKHTLPSLLGESEGGGAAFQWRNNSACGRSVGPPQVNKLDPKVPRPGLAVKLCVPRARLSLGGWGRACKGSNRLGGSQTRQQTAARRPLESSSQWPGSVRDATCDGAGVGVGLCSFLIVQVCKDETVEQVQPPRSDK